MDLYTRSAPYYDLIYAPIVDYRRESELLEGAFKKYAGREVQCILDLGCGTGNHAFALAARGYEVLGLDLNEEFIALARDKARRRRGRASFEAGDMRVLPSDKPFDAIISMFGAFDHVAKKDAPATLRQFPDLLEPGGLLLFEWWNQAGAIDGYSDWLEREVEDLYLLRLGKARVPAEGGTVELTLKHLVLRNDQLEEVFTERGTLALYEMEEMRTLLEGAGLEPLAMLDWSRKSLKPSRPKDYRVLAVARKG